MYPVALFLNTLDWKVGCSQKKWDTSLAEVVPSLGPVHWSICIALLWQVPHCSWDWGLNNSAVFNPVLNSAVSLVKPWLS